VWSAACAAICQQRSSATIVEERSCHETEITLLPADNKVIALHPSVLARYERQVEQLQASMMAGALNDDNDGVAAFRELIESVTVKRVPGGCQD
jgi:site-specific DNA recombinase